MKKILLMALACLFLFTSVASANGWGLKGGAYPTRRLQKKLKNRANCPVFFTLAKQGLHQRS